MASEVEPSRARSLASAVGLFTLALCVRVLPWHFVFRPQGIELHGNDAYYHLRRIQYGVANFPDVLAFDPYIQFPHGAQPIWPPTLDWLIAALARVLAGSGDPQRVESLVVWLPAVAGAATVVMLYRLATRFYSARVAALAGGILALLPAHFFYSQLGFVDHHAFVAPISTWMLGSMMGLLSSSGETSRGDGDVRWRQGVALGLGMAAALLLWPGALIHVGIVQAGMVVQLLAAGDDREAIAWSKRFALAHAVALLCVAPLSAGNEWQRWGSYSAVVLSNFQPLYLGAALLCFLGVGALWRSGWLCGDRRRRALAAAACAVLLGGLLLASVQELRQSILDAWAWLAKREAFQAAVNESAPLLRDFTTLHRSRATGLFSVFLYVVPAAIAWLAWRSRGQAERLFFLGWALALFAATLLQWRFMNSYSVAHALLIALVVESIRDALAARLSTPSARRTATAVTLIVVLYLLVPVLYSYRPHLLNLQRALAGEPPLLDAHARRQSLIIETARWLAESSPPPERDPYSVLAPWGDGHILKYVAQRPTVQDNFGDDVGVEGFALAEDYYAATDEGAALAILARTSTRYVVARATGSGHPAGEYADESMQVRLYELRGSTGRRASGGRSPVPALTRHRLVYESARVHAGRGEPQSRVYEIVEGARIVGETDPGAPVRVELGLQSRLGGELHYSASTRADDQGRYEIVVPYSNEPFSTEVEAGARYSLRSGEAYGFVVISDEAVRNGERVEGPSLRGGRAARPRTTPLP